MIDNLYISANCLKLDSSLMCSICIFLSAKKLFFKNRNDTFGGKFLSLQSLKTYLIQLCQANETEFETGLNIIETDLTSSSDDDNVSKCSSEVEETNTLDLPPLVQNTPASVLTPTFNRPVSEVILPTTAGQMMALTSAATNVPNIQLIINQQQKNLGNSSNVVPFHHVVSLPSLSTTQLDNSRTNLQNSINENSTDQTLNLEVAKTLISSLQNQNNLNLLQTQNLTNFLNLANNLPVSQQNSTSTLHVPVTSSLQVLHNQNSNSCSGVDSGLNSQNNSPDVEEMNEKILSKSNCNKMEQLGNTNLLNSNHLNQK